MYVSDIWQYEVCAMKSLVLLGLLAVGVLCAPLADQDQAAAAAQEVADNELRGKQITGLTLTIMT